MKEEAFDYSTFEKDTFQVWIYRLKASFYRINAEIYDKTGKDLNGPSFAIKEHLDHNAWGMWQPTEKIISIKLALLKNFEWGAVERVLRHEMAHMIVSQIFNIDTRPHGEIFKIACETAGVPHDRLTSEEMLKDFKGTTFSPMADKVRKLMIHGNDNGCTKEEAETFLSKAQDIMIRHNIKMTDICGTERVFVKRPVGPIFKRQPIWIWALTSIVKDSCNVEGIMIPSNDGVRIELYGEPQNLDVAEYIFHALLIQGKYLYDKYLANHKKIKQIEKEIKLLKKKQVIFDNSVDKKQDILNNINDRVNNGIYYKESKPSSAAYLLGLFQGYKDKLDQDREVVCDKIEAEDGTVVTTEDKVLKEMYENAYHPRKIGGRSASYNTHFSNGRNAGKNLTLAKAVNNSGNRSNLIGA